MSDVENNTDVQDNFEQQSADVQGGSDSNADAVAEMVQETRFDFVSDKYRKEGRSEQESLQEQAKAYTELEKRFGSFTGAPDEYALGVSDEMKEMGIELDAEDPLIEQAMEFAKNSNMSQQGFNNLVDLYIKTQIADQQAIEDVRQEELKQLGSNAQQRIDNIANWAQANLDPELFEGVQELAHSATMVRALEAIISKTGSAPINPGNTTANSGYTAEDVRKMQLETDEYGRRRLSSDPEFAKKFREISNLVHGAGEHREIVG